QGRHHTDEGQRYGEHDHQRIEEAFELRRHYHVDQHNRHEDRHGEILLGFQLLLVLSAHYHRKILRHFHGGQIVLDGAHGIAQRHAFFQAGVDVDDTLAIDALDLRGTTPVVGNEQRGHRDYLAVGAAYR